MYVYIHIYIHISFFIYLDSYIYIHIYMFMNIYIYTHMFINTTYVTTAVDLKPTFSSSFFQPWTALPAEGGMSFATQNGATQSTPERNRVSASHALWCARWGQNRSTNISKNDHGAMLIPEMCFLKAIIKWNSREQFVCVSIPNGWQELITLLSSQFTSLHHITSLHRNIIPGNKKKTKGFKGISPPEANLPMPLFLQAATTRRSHVRSAAIDHLDVSCDIPWLITLLQMTALKVI